LSKRALIIGSDRDYCHVIKEFLELGELYVKVVLDYHEGLDRLSYEKPDITVIENIGGQIRPELPYSVMDSDEFEIVDFPGGRKTDNHLKTVLFFEDKNHINSLFEFLKTEFRKGNDQTANPEVEDEGNLGSVFYPSLLIDIYYKKRSGRLSIFSSTESRIYFINGSPVFAEGGEIETAIGRLLLDQKRITRDTYEKALDAARTSEKKFGETLFEMGEISPHELNNLLETQMEEKLITGFCYTGGRYEFESGEDFVERLISYNINLPKVIREGIVKFIDTHKLAEENPAITVSSQYAAKADNLGLQPKQLRFLHLLKENDTVANALSNSPLNENEALNFLYFLGLFRILEFGETSIEKIGRESIDDYILEHESLTTSGGKEILMPDEHGLFSEPHEGTEGRILSGENQQTEQPADDETDFENSNRESVQPENKIWEIGFDDFQLPDDQEPGDLPYGQTETGDVISELSVDDSEQEKELDNLTPDTDSEVDALEYIKLDSGSGETEQVDQDMCLPHSDDESVELSDTESPDSTAFGDELSYNRSESPFHEFDAPEDEETGGEQDIELDSSYTGDDGEPHMDSENDAVPSDEAWPDGGYEEIELDFSGYELPEDDRTDETVNPFRSPVEESSGDYTELNAEGYQASPDSESIEIEDGQPTASVPETEIGSEEAHKQDTQPERVRAFYEGLQAKDHYQVLGVERGASSTEIRDAYYRLVKFYHPDVNPKADHDTRLQAEEIFTKISAAYETLTDPEKRELYDSQDELSELKSSAKYIYEAEVNFKKGITFLIQRNYEEAEKKLKEALDLNPDEPAYIGAHAWTQFLCGKNQPQVMEKAKKTILGAISKNDKIAENYYYLASIFKHENNLKKAEEYYKKAVELDPDYIEAKREIRLINTRKIQNKNEKNAEKGFWSSLFKR